MKRTPLITFLMILIAIVSLSAILTNFGYPNRTILTTTSGAILFLIGACTIFAVLSRRTWGTIAMTGWFLYGIVNNFVFYFVYRTGSNWYPIAAAVILAVFYKRIMTRVKKYIDGV